MGKETLSVSQANVIINSFSEAMMESKKNIEIKLDHFLEELSRLWEDHNAVELSKRMNRNYINLLKTTNNNLYFFELTVREIAAKYISIGNMFRESVTAQVIKLDGKLSYEIIHEYFVNSENEDDFGLKEANYSGLQSIIEIFNELERNLETEAQATENRLRKTQAFGNQEVQQLVVSIATEISLKIKQYLRNMKIYTNNLLQDTVSSYIAAGKASLSDFYTAPGNEENSWTSSTPSGPRETTPTTHSMPKPQTPNLTPSESGETTPASHPIPEPQTPNLTPSGSGETTPTTHSMPKPQTPWHFGLESSQNPSNNDSGK